MKSLFKFPSAALFILRFLLTRLQISCASASNTDPELVYVHVLWRHGDRTGFKGNTLGVAKDIPWAEGDSELTTIGMNQTFELGQFLRGRYYNYIMPPRTNMIYVRSTDYNRTLMSAQGVLAGLLYPPLQNQTFRNNIPWFPFPVHTRPREEDTMLWMDAPCAKFDQLYNGPEGILQSPAVKQLDGENEDFFLFLEEKSNKSIKTIDDIWQIADAMTVQKAHADSHPLPVWAQKKTIQDKVQYLFGQSLNYYYFTLELQRLRGGELLQDIGDRMEAAAQAHSNGEDIIPEFLYTYSAHDTTVVALLKNLGAFNSVQPPYAAAVMMELKAYNSNYTVELYYCNTTCTVASQPYRLEIDGCPHPCSLDQFIERSKSHIPSDWAKECANSASIFFSKYFGQKAVFLILICLATSIF